MDRFPEAFERFERDVDVERIRSFRQLRVAFSWWAGEKWKGSRAQIEALKVEAERLGIPLERRRYTYIYLHGKTYGRREIIVRRSREVTIYRDIRTGRFTRKSR